MADIPRDIPRAEVRLPLRERLLYAIPILGWMPKDGAYGRPSCCSTASCCRRPV